ncbi:winged helix-turn-helix transcriptional regulator [[Mannheimia] succiniciproducens]|uniref:winged helix-turn-helix transcriptional regulator n=1 Tax=[Mannheimia] succiniciproducens TaxID=157673 RepID=UPI000C7D685C
MAINISLDLQQLLEGGSPKVLSEQLCQLEADGLIVRCIYSEVLPLVEYSLTDEGAGLNLCSECCVNGVVVTTSG